MQLSEFIILFLLIPSLCFGAFPTTGILDNFNRADESPPMTGYESYSTGFGVTSNQCANTGSGGSAFWAALYGSDVEAYYTLLTAGSAVFIFLRYNSTPGNGYLIRYSVGSGIIKMDRRDAFVDTLIGSGSAYTPAVNDKIGFRAVGSTLTAWKNTGSGWSADITVTDSTYTNNNDLMFYSGTVPMVIDDFSGGKVRRIIMVE